MPMTIAKICRYPVKGLSAETLDAVSLSIDSGLPHDRRFAIARGAAPPGSEDGAWQPKSAFHQLQREERLAQLRVAFDAETGLLTLERHGRQVARGDPGDPLGRTLLTQFFAAFLGGGGQAAPRIVAARERAFTDAPDPFVSLVNLASVADLARVIGQAPDPLRFRANLYVEGAPAWEEANWIGRNLRIGTATLKVIDSIERCAATNVDPETAERDLNLPLALQRGYGHCRMGLYLSVLEAGELAPKDGMSLID